MSGPVVSTEVATVYRVGSRRYLSRAGAFAASARAMIAARCECEPSDDGAIGSGYPGYACSYHRDQEHYVALVKRLARFIRRQARGAR